MSATIHYDNIQIETARALGQIKGALIAKRYEPPVDLLKRELHARVLSNLANLELIAIEAAKRGDGIQDQLKDEFFHHFAFKFCAEKAGKLYEPDEHTQALIDYMQSLDGPDSVAVLNVVAEGWLETVFKYLANVPDFIPDLFKQIEDDEHRHSNQAMEADITYSESIVDLVRDIEKLLFKIANSPFFMLPLVHVLGREACSYMGEALARSHERSCRHLGVIPRVSKIKALARNGRNLLRNAPVEVEMRPWDVIKSRMWKTSNEAAQVLYKRINIPDFVKTNPVSVQLRLIRSLGVVYMSRPHLRRVYRNGQIYQPKTTILGLRTTHVDMDQVGSIFFNPTKYPNDRRLLRMINRRKDRMDKEPYELIPDFGELEKFMYPSYAVATVSSNGAYGGDYGCGPLIDIEGIGTAFTIGEIQREDTYANARLTDSGEMRRPSYFILAIKMDHRLGDGKQLGELAAATKKQFESHTFL